MILYFYNARKFKMKTTYVKIQLFRERKQNSVSIEFRYGNLVFEKNSKLESIYRCRSK